MLIKTPADILPSEITPPALHRDRRRFLREAGRSLAAGAAWWHGLGPASASPPPPAGPGPLRPSPFSSAEAATSREAVTGYNNFYEFGTDKHDPAARAGRLQTRPWTVRVEGLVGRPRTFDLDQLLKLAPLEERIYRMRCVEGWSMVIPWLGFPLATLLQQVQPLGSATHVAFFSHYDPQIMTQRPVLDWPYREGLRLDEALHPLTILALGLYGEVLPNQNGAPLRLVVPWKYGFKSAKSITTIRLLDRQPATAWNRAAPREYGFFSNVNPEIDHPRWSQASERRIGELRKRPTLMFNGYAEQVAGLYRGLDLRVNF